MNIVCVRQGDKFGPEYTRMLRRMVEKYADRSLLVLGDGTDANVRLEYALSGWHAKLELFRPDLDYLRPFLYFDLDTYILDGIDDLVDAAENIDRLTLIRDFNVPRRGNSGVMMIPINTNDIWNDRRVDIADGDYLDTHPHDFIQDNHEGIVSFKNDCKREPTGRVVCFHGQPKPHNAEGWASRVWWRYIYGGV